MVHLLDVNLLVALGWGNHAHNAAARAWFTAHAPQGWATCPITQLGFVRISSNPRLPGGGATLVQALDALRLLTSHPNHVFWPDDVAFTDAAYVPHASIRGHQQVTDAHLIGLAVQHGGRLATLDRALSTLLPPNQRDTVVLIPTTGP